MKQRHMEGEDHSLRFLAFRYLSKGSINYQGCGIKHILPSLEEILDETNQLDVSGKTRQWLQQEALNHNPKIEVTWLKGLMVEECNDSNDRWILLLAAYSIFAREIWRIR